MTSETTTQNITPATCQSCLLSLYRDWYKNWLVPNCWPVLGLLLLVTIIYAPVVSFDFVNWDDTWYIVNNDLIKTWHPSSLYKVMTESVARNFAPLTITTFLVEHSLWKLWPGGYHLSNLFIHAINAVLVFALVKQLTKNQMLAWLTAALFAVHPVQVETVAWISSRKTLLSATFMLASLICWLKQERTGKDEGWGILWLLFGLLSKAATVVIPPIVVAYDVLIARKTFKESIARQIIPMFFCVMLILITMSAQVTIVGGIRGHIGMNKLQLLAIDSTLLWRYVVMLLVPKDLCVLYDTPMHNIAGFIAFSLISWTAIAVGLWRYHQKTPWLAFAAASWILLLVPVLNLFPITTLMNDRYLYLPCVPFFAICIGGIQNLYHRCQSFEFKVLKAAPALGVIFSVALLGMYTATTLEQINIWKNPVSLWSHARQNAKTLPVVHIQWAITLKEIGDTQGAAQALTYALHNCNPDEADKQRILTKLEELRTEG